jgi:hypothetical protein
MKITPTARPVTSLLLQPWSTATSQTKNSATASTPMIFISTVYLLNSSVHDLATLRKGMSHSDE